MSNTLLSVSNSSKLAVQPTQAGFGLSKTFAAATSKVSSIAKGLFNGLLTAVSTLGKGIVGGVKNFSVYFGQKLPAGFASLVKNNKVVFSVGLIGLASVLAYVYFKKNEVSVEAKDTQPESAPVDSQATEAQKEPKKIEELPPEKSGEASNETPTPPEGAK